MARVKSLAELYDYALTFYGLPYIWGGDGTGIHVQKGFDCSGLVQQILRAAEMDPPGDQTAQGLYDHFLKNGDGDFFGLGALAFFGTPGHISHVGWCIDSKIMINAAGGGSHCKTIEVARKLNASVKIQPVKRRPDFAACIMPRYQLPIT